VVCWVWRIGSVSRERPRNFEVLRASTSSHGDDEVAIIVLCRCRFGAASFAPPIEVTTSSLGDDEGRLVGRSGVSRVCLESVGGDNFLSPPLFVRWGKINPLLCLPLFQPLLPYYLFIKILIRYTSLIILEMTSLPFSIPSSHTRLGGKGHSCLFVSLAPGRLDPR
jgi:hypothetical protein